jgi:hypothetical protein
MYSHNSTTERFIQVLQSLHSHRDTIQAQPLFIFERSREAALHNAIVLKSYNFNIDQATRAQEGSQVFYGSEFKHFSLLQELLEHHPHWNSLRNILKNGATFPLLPISQEERLRDLSFHKGRGNHKSVSKNLMKINNIISDEINRGFALPLPPEILYCIPNASLAPLGCIEQESINELGEKIPKFRMTHVT